MTAICPSTRLPTFPTEKERKSFYDYLGSTILRSWKCKACGGFHCWTKPPSPAGGSSGTTRHYQIPEHALKLIRETEDRTVSLFPNL